MGVADGLLASPIALAVLSAALTAAIGVGAVYLGPGADWIDRWKIRLLPRLDGVARRVPVVGRPLVAEKDLGSEYVLSAKPAPDALDPVWDDAGFDRSLFSTAKYRTLPDGTRQYAVRQWVYRESADAPEQHHVYVFPGGRDAYASDVNAHVEASVTRPADHQGGGTQTPGDPEGFIRDTLASAGVTWTARPPEDG